MEPLKGLEKLVRAFKRIEDHKAEAITAASKGDNSAEKHIKAGMKKGDISKCEADELRLEYVNSVISEYEFGEYSLKETMKMLDRMLDYSQNHSLDTSKIKEAGLSVAEDLINYIERDIDSIDPKTQMSTLFSGIDSIEHCIETYGIMNTELILNYEVIRSLTEDDVRAMQTPFDAEEKEALSIAGKTRMILRAKDAAGKYERHTMDSHFQEYKDRTGKDMPAESKKGVLVDYINAGLNRFNRQLTNILNEEVEKPLAASTVVIEAYNMLHQIDQESNEYGFDTGLEKRFSLLIEPLQKNGNLYIVEGEFDCARECIDAANECINRCKEDNEDVLFNQQELEDMTDPNLGTTEEKINLARKRAGIRNPETGVIERLNTILESPYSRKAVSESATPKLFLDETKIHQYPSIN
ncbi:MAG: hypothetical protein GY861_28465 [bacterium]|nr:hypothetical protein [bacterium]